MDILDQEITESYAIYNGDCIEVMKGVPSESIHLSLYSPPFSAVYTHILAPNVT